MSGATAGGAARHADAGTGGHVGDAAAAPASPPAAPRVLGMLKVSLLRCRLEKNNGVSGASSSKRSVDVARRAGEAAVCVLHIDRQRVVDVATRAPRGVPNLRKRHHRSLPRRSTSGADEYDPGLAVSGEAAASHGALVWPRAARTIAAPILCAGSTNSGRSGSPSSSHVVTAPTAWLELWRARKCLGTGVIPYRLPHDEGESLPSLAALSAWVPVRRPALATVELMSVESSSPVGEIDVSVVFEPAAGMEAMPSAYHDAPRAIDASDAPADAEEAATAASEGPVGPSVDARGSNGVEPASVPAAAAPTTREKVVQGGTAAAASSSDRAEPTFAVAPPIVGAVPGSPGVIVVEAVKARNLPLQRKDTSLRFILWLEDERDEETGQVRRSRQARGEGQPAGQAVSAAFTTTVTDGGNATTWNSGHRDAGGVLRLPVDGDPTQPLCIFLEVWRPPRDSSPGAVGKRLIGTAQLPTRIFGFKALTQVTVRLKGAAGSSVGEVDVCLRYAPSARGCPSSAKLPEQHGQVATRHDHSSPEGGTPPTRPHMSQREKRVAEARELRDVIRRGARPSSSPVGSGGDGAGGTGGDSGDSHSFRSPKASSGGGSSSPSDSPPKSSAGAQLPTARRSMPHLQTSSEDSSCDASTISTKFQRRSPRESAPPGLFRKASRAVSSPLQLSESKGRASPQEIHEESEAVAELRKELAAQEALQSRIAEMERRNRALEAQLASGRTDPGAEESLGSTKVAAAADATPEFREPSAQLRPRSTIRKDVEGGDGVSDGDELAGRVAQLQTEAGASIDFHLLKREMPDITPQQANAARRIAAWSQPRYKGRAIRRRLAAARRYRQQRASDLRRRDGAVRLIQRVARGGMARKVVRELARRVAQRRLIAEREAALREARRRAMEAEAALRAARGVREARLQQEAEEIAAAAAWAQASSRQATARSRTAMAEQQAWEAEMTTTARRDDVTARLHRLTSALSARRAGSGATGEVSRAELLQRVDSAAVSVQRVFRGHLARRGSTLQQRLQALQYKEAALAAAEATERNAASCIQRVARGRLGRKRFSEVARAVAEKRSLLEAAAHDTMRLRIQAVAKRRMRDQMRPRQLRKQRTAAASAATQVAAEVSDPVAWSRAVMSPVRAVPTPKKAAVPVWRRQPQMPINTRTRAGGALPATARLASGGTFGGGFGRDGPSPRLPKPERKSPASTSPARKVAAYRRGSRSLSPRRSPAASVSSSLATSRSREAQQSTPRPGAVGVEQAVVPARRKLVLSTSDGWSSPLSIGHEKYASSVRSSRSPASPSRFGSSMTLSTSAGASPSAPQAQGSARAPDGYSLGVLPKSAEEWTTMWSRASVIRSAGHWDECEAALPDGDVLHFFYSTAVGVGVTGLADAGDLYDEELRKLCLRVPDKANGPSRSTHPASEPQAAAPVASLPLESPRELQLAAAPPPKRAGQIGARDAAPQQKADTDPPYSVPAQPPSAGGASMFAWSFERLLSVAKPVTPTTVASPGRTGVRPSPRVRPLGTPRH